jgi:hypothetical protein
VDAAGLKQALVAHFALQDSAAWQSDFQIDNTTLDLHLHNEKETWGIVFCPDKADGAGYFGAFEAAMQRVVDARRAGPADLQLGMAVAFASTAHGQSPSYRRALKKYSNSVVFEDLGLHLFLVTGEKAVDVLKPAEVNGFMRDLDKWIAEQKKS